jgi:tetratricopeptide (TPR) repeat protein
MGQAALVEGKLDRWRAGPAYAAAFRAQRLDVLRDEPAEVAEKLRSWGVARQAAAALDDWALQERGEVRRRLFEVARRADPDAERNRFRHPDLWRDRARLRRLAWQADLGRLSPAMLEALGQVVEGSGGDSVRLLGEGQRRHPGDFWLSFALANLLAQKGRAAEAVGYYAAALAVRPDSVIVYNNLGVALSARKDVEGAIACFRMAIRLAPKLATAHNNLGLALFDHKDLEGALACYRKAIALDPKNPHAYYNLGNVLYGQKDVEGAISCYRKAIALDPKYAPAHTNLGLALYGQKDVDGAIACYRKAIALDPKLAQAHNNLGLALYDKKNLDGAIACYRKAIVLDPKDASAHYNLGNALKGKGDLEGAIPCFRKAIAFDPKHANAHGTLGLALLEQRQPSAAECLQCARPSASTGRYLTAARLYAKAFAAEAKLAGDLHASHRYRAARAAARAGCGQGSDAGKLADKERARWRKQALAWLRADLALWRKQADSDKVARQAEVRRQLRHWQRDSDLQCVRDKEALAKLPEAERADWKKLWADVEALLKKPPEEDG